MALKVIYYIQGRRNSIISGEATSNIANFFALFPKKLVCQPLISGEAAASPASPVPTPLKNLLIIVVVIIKSMYVNAMIKIINNCTSKIGVCNRA